MKLLFIFEFLMIGIISVLAYVVSKEGALTVLSFYSGLSIMLTIGLVGKEIEL